MRWSLLFVPLCLSARQITLPNENLENIGTSAGYNIASEILTNSINFSVDPCEDFFEFSCGNWVANHAIPKDNVRYSPFEMLFEKVQEQMRDILESNEMFESKSMNAVKYIYKRCMDKDELNRIGARRFIERVRSFGVWPILEGDENWREENFDLTSLLIYVKQMRGVNVFVKSSITADIKNVSRYLITFDQDDLNMYDYTREFYLDSKRHEKLEQEILSLQRFLQELCENEELDKRLQEHCGMIKRFLEAQKLSIRKVELLQTDGDLPINKTKTEEDLNETLGLEMKLARMLVPDEDRRNQIKYYHLRHLSDTQQLVPVVNWSRFFFAVAPSASHPYLKSDPEIVIADIDYLKRMQELLQSTNSRIITNYIFMRLALQYDREMGEKYEDISQEFLKLTMGKLQNEPRWKYCTSQTMQLLKYASSAIYVKKAFDQSSKNLTVEMTNDLLEIFREILGTNRWMDDRTRAAALDKLDQMLPQIAYPDFILDNEKLDQYYDGLDVQDTDSYSEMLEKVERWKNKYLFELLTKPMGRSEYEFSSTTANCLYLPTANTIRISAAMLQAPIFHHTFPRALIYGGLGAFIGHEITHGFDDTGRQFDAYGNLREWWDPNVKKQFEDRAQCIIKQYEKIEVPGTGLNISGKLVLGEIIADNGGVKQAYKAYKAYLHNLGREEKRIKGVEQFDNERMFFLGYAMVRCEHTTRKAAPFQILIDTHPPQRYRVNQVLANQPEFAAAFKCEMGSAMNPTERCTVW